MEQEFIDLYDEYTHRPLPRRVFLERLARLAGGTAAAAALLPVLEGSMALAATVSADDDRLETLRTLYPGSSAEVTAYMARLRGGERLPAVVVIHENRGLNAHIEDVTRRLAVEGFLALAPDALSPAGGTPSDQDRAREMIQQLDPGATLADYVAAAEFLDGHPGSNGRVGCVGFCWGGAMANRLAIASPSLDAAVAYYGRVLESDAVAKLRAPLLLHYAGLDSRINEGVPAFEAALKREGKPYTLHMYEGVNHAFNNDTNPARYDAGAAELAWQRTLAFLKQQLSA